MAVVVTALTNAIAEALVAAWSEPDYSPDARLYLRDAEAAADACIAVVAALPETYTAADVLAFLRGQDDSAGWLKASHVDNASAGTAEDQHPCGGVKGPHSWPDEDTAPQHVADRCVDCGTTFGDWIEATA